MLHSESFDGTDGDETDLALRYTGTFYGTISAMYARTGTYGLDIGGGPIFHPIVPNGAAPYTIYQGAAFYWNGESDVLLGLTNATVSAAGWQCTVRSIDTGQIAVYRGSTTQVSLSSGIVLIIAP